MESFISNASAAAESPRCIYVLSDVDGYRYKLVIQSEMEDLTVRRIKKYLHRAAGVESAQQLLTFNGIPLRDNMNGQEAGLFDGAILRLQQVAPDALENFRSGTYDSQPQHAPQVRRQDAHKEQPSKSGVGALNSFHQPQQQKKQYALVTEEKQPLSSSSPPASSATPTAAPSPPLATPPHPRSQQQSSEQHVCRRPARFSATSHLHRSFSAPQPPSAARSHTTHGPLSSRDYLNGKFAVLPVPLSAGSEEGGFFSSAEAETRCRDMEAKVATLSIENVRLREQLQMVARQAANAQSDWRQEEEIRHLKADLAAAKKSITEAEVAASQRWRVKEEELVKELDLLREERRRLQEDASGQETKLQDLLHSLEGEIRSLQYELHDKDEALQSARLSLAGLSDEAQSRGLRPSTQQLGRGDSLMHGAAPREEDVDALADDALSHLSYFLNTAAPLQLDSANDTCLLPVSPTLNVLITLDRETERLYLYATLLNELPPSPTVRMRLYEMLLQGALLGKDMAGGGVGMSLESNMILMSTSADLRHGGALSLAAAAPAFVEAAVTWEESIAELLRD